MKQVFLRDQDVVIQEVPAPAPDVRGVIVETHVAAISVGTETGAIRAARQRGGRPLAFCAACHFFDLLCYLVGSDPASVTAAGGTLSHPGTKLCDDLQGQPSPADAEAGRKAMLCAFGVLQALRSGEAQSLEL